MEGFQRGFDYVLWIDSSMIPLKNPTPFFHVIEQTGGFFIGPWKHTGNDFEAITPRARSELRRLFNNDPCMNKISGTHFGLNKKSPSTKRFIDGYYQALGNGIVFMSCFPEEYVFSSLISFAGFSDQSFSKNQRSLDAQLFQNNPSDGLFQRDPDESNNSENRCYFFWHPH